MLTSRALLAPSLPTMLIDEQRGDVTELIEALEGAGRRLSQEDPAVFVVLSPRWVSPDAFHADDARRHRSVVDLPQFGVEPRHDCAGHPELARAIVREAGRSGVRAAAAAHGLDSGASVALHFLDRDRRTPVVPVSIGRGGADLHRAWGAALRRALEAHAERVAFVVGGALSWNLHAFGLRRELDECAELDRRVIEALATRRFGDLAGVIATLGERARPEADLHHLDVLAGFVGEHGAPPVVLERDHLPGIGAALVEFPLAAAAPAEQP
ncbi:MAG TPA: hypothetical protein VMH61_04525 [Candidatus Acidoferrales bacterium]|nr:hypothetical protein [Candidatus Acidoferrales bacterium]